MAVGLLVIDDGAEVVLDNVSIHDTRAPDDPPDDQASPYTAGVAVAGGGSLSVIGLTVTESEFAAVHFISTELPQTATGRLEDVTIDGGRATQGWLGLGIVADNGTTLELVDVSLNDIEGYGFYFAGDATRVDATRLTLSDVDAWGGQVSAGADLQAQTLVIAGAGDGGLMFSDSGTGVVDDLAISGLGGGSENAMAAALVAQVGSVATVTDYRFTGDQGLGIYVPPAGGLTVSDCTIDGASFASAGVTEGRLVLTDCDLGPPAADASEGGGVGVFAGVAEGTTTLVVPDTTVAAGPYAGVWINGPGSYQLFDSTISGGAKVELAPGVLIHGDALFATHGVGPWVDEQGLYVAHTTLHDADGAGVFLQGASATFEHITWTDNAVDVVQQVCSEDVPTPAGLGEDLSVSLCPTDEALVNEFDFELDLDVPELASE